MILLECITVMSVACVFWDYSKRGVSVSTFILSVIPLGVMGYICGGWSYPLVLVGVVFCEWGYQSMRIGAVRSSDKFLNAGFKLIMIDGPENIHAEERGAIEHFEIDELEELCSV